MILFSAATAFSAGFAGTWAISSKDGEGNPVKSEITFREEGGALKALLKAGEMRREIDGIKLEGDRVSFVIPWQEARVNVVLNAVGDKLNGSWNVEGDSGSITGARMVQSGIGGVWKLTAERPGGDPILVDLDLKSAGNAWQGVLRRGEGQELAIQGIAVSADQVSFVIPMAQGNVKLVLKVEGDSLKGSWTGADAATGAVTGKR